MFNFYDYLSCWTGGRNSWVVVVVVFRLSVLEIILYSFAQHRYCRHSYM